MSSSENTIFGTVLGYAHRAGHLARDAATAAQAAWTSVEPAVTAALAKAKSLADPQARAQALEQFDAILARAKVTGASAMSDIEKAVTSLKEAANGMPPQVALKLATFAKLQEAAASKGCLELTEVVECTQAFNEVRDSIKTDPAKGISTQTNDKLDALIISAGSAVDQFSFDDVVVQGILADANTLLGDIRSANTKVVAAQNKYLSTILGAQKADVDLGVQIDALSARLAPAQAAVEASNFASAAVVVHNWIADANKLMAERKQALKAMTKKSSEPDSIEGVFGPIYRRAERMNFVGDNGNEKLNELASAVLTAARLRPCDVAAAQAALGAFQEKLSLLEAEAKTKA